MKQQIVFGEWWEIDTEDGTIFIPMDIVGDNPKPGDFIDYIESDNLSDLYGYELVKGYGARLSAPGYLDCTPWVVVDTEEGAKEFLKDAYNVED